MRERKTFFRRSGFLIALLMVFVLAIGLIGTAYAAKPTPNYQLIAFGVKTDSTGTLVTDIGWGRGNSDKGWREGDWIPVKCEISGLQTPYPGLEGLPDICLSWDFTMQNGARFVDLVRSVQIGLDDLIDEQGWPQADGSPYNTGSPSALPDLADVHIAQESPGCNTWTDWVNVTNDTLINYPLAKKEGILADPIRPGEVDDKEHQLLIPAGVVKDALDDLDLMHGGIGDGSETDTIYIYLQCHLSRTFVWIHHNELQYNATPYDEWGGDLYGDPIYAMDARIGSYGGSGSSTHMTVSMPGVGAITCQLPIPPRPYGFIDGHKFNDANNNCNWDEEELGLPGWRMYLYGVDPEGLIFTDTVLTDSSGYFSFPDLTDGDWYVAEDIAREEPDEDTWSQSYPCSIGMPVDPVAISIDSSTIPQPSAPDFGPRGYLVQLNEVTNSTQHDIDFGNVEMGCLEVTKQIDWDDLVGDPADVPDVDFTVVVTGPSYPTGHDLVFHLVDGEVYFDDEMDATACLCDLIPGNYTVTEPVMPAGWECVASEVEILYDDPATVLPCTECDVDAIEVIVTNPVPQGCLEVTKEIDWDDLIGDPADVPDVDFTVVVTGPSYPTGHDLVFHLVDGVVTYDGEADATACLCNLIPGDYYVTEPVVPEYWELVQILYDDPATVLPCTECDVDAIEVIVRNIPVPADLSVEKTGEITYTIVVRNEGQSPALNVEVNDPLPGSLNWTILDVTPTLGTWDITSAWPNQMTLTGTIDSLAFGESVTVTVMAEIDGHSDNPMLGNEVTVSTTSLESADWNNVDWADIFPFPLF